MMDEQASQTGSGSAMMVSAPDPEAPLKAERWQFSAEYKLRVLAEADHGKGSGEIGALLRREGLYRSHLEKWRTTCAMLTISASWCSSTSSMTGAGRKS